MSDLLSVLRCFKGCVTLASCLLLLALGVAAPLAAADFNGDGKSDLIWRRGDGKPVLWLMDGLQAPQRITLSNSLDNSVGFAAIGAFGGGSAQDLLLIDSNSLGSIWRLNASGLASQCALSTVASIGNEFLAGADVDGDGRTDVLWRRPGGDLRVWLMNGCNVTSNDLTAVIAANWTFQGARDFDGDGKADLLWRDGAAMLHLWTMNGAQIASTANLQTGNYASWDIVSTGDFDGDGSADLLWRNAQGLLAIWFMHGNTHTESVLAMASTDGVFYNGFESGAFASDPQSLPLSWHVLPGADVNGDGREDIIAADSLGNVLVRTMNGASVVGEVTLPPDEQMPYPGFTGWTLPLERPTATSVAGQVDVTWQLLPGFASYQASASDTHDPFTTGITYDVGYRLPYLRSDPTFATTRYFSVAANFFGLVTPPAPEAYLLDFDQSPLPMWGAMSVADINGDGCMDLLGAFGDCHGHFSVVPEASMGLGALRAPERVYTDLRFADFDGDGIDDAIANVYSPNLPPSNQLSYAMLFRGEGNGQFAEDAAFSAMHLGGFGETIVVADFDNDGDLDIYLPNYTFYAPEARCFLLVNDGHGHFTESATAAGVDMPNWDLEHRAEGVQALDINNDGLIDIYAGSHLYINYTTTPDHPIFVDERLIRGLPLQFDEGAKFIDWNADGLMDLIIQFPYTPPILMQGNGYGFTVQNVFSQTPLYNQVFGLNAADVDGDGLPDLIVAGGCSDVVHPDCLSAGYPHAKPKLLLNRGTQFVLSDFYEDGYSDTQRPLDDLQSYADFDNDGGIDLITRYRSSEPETGLDSGEMRVLRNRGNGPVIRVRLLGAGGQRNQYGRIVKVEPMQRPGFIMTQAIDSGSGYLSNSPYDVEFAANYPGGYRISASFASQSVVVMARAGDTVEIRENGAIRLLSNSKVPLH
jgi:hypothetical protein